MTSPFASLSPLARRILGAGALLVGVLVVGAQLRANAPRDVELRLSLRDFDDAHRIVRAVSVTFSRDDRPFRALTRRYDGDAPRELVERVSLPEGPARAQVSVTLDGLVVERAVDLTIAPGEVLTVPAPALPP